MAEASDVVRASRLEIVDRHGRVRVVIGTIAEQEDAGDLVGLTIQDAHGNDRLYLVVDNEVAEAGGTACGNNVVSVSLSPAGTAACLLMSVDAAAVVARATNTTT